MFRETFSGEDFLARFRGRFSGEVLWQIFPVRFCGRFSGEVLK